MEFAFIQFEKLSDQSGVWNVVVPEDEHRARVVIGCQSQEAAERIAEAVNQGAAFVVA